MEDVRGGQRWEILFGCKDRKQTGRGEDLFRQSGPKTVASCLAYRGVLVVGLKARTARIAPNPNLVGHIWTNIPNKYCVL